jgi:hypothetical protein
MTEADIFKPIDWTTWAKGPTLIRLFNGEKAVAEFWLEDGGDGPKPFLLRLVDKPDEP